MRLYSLCRIGVLFPVRLSLETPWGLCWKSDPTSRFRYSLPLLGDKFGQIWFNNHLWRPDALVLTNLIVSCSTMMTAPKLAEIRFQVRRRWSLSTLLPVDFHAIVAIEPISARLLNAIWDLIQHARTASFARNSYCKFAMRIFLLFVILPATFSKLAIVWQALRG